MRLEQDGPLARLRLNRPEVLNAANRAWVQDLVTAMDYLAHSTETRVVLVSGEGRAFCSGLDTKALAHGKLTVEWFETWERGVTALAELDAITIATVRLARLIGAAAAKELCFLGRRFSAEEGLALRLITEVVPPVMLEERALALAEELLSIPFPALLYTKRQIDRAFGQDTEMPLNEMTAVYEDCLRSLEHATVKTDLLAREKKT